ncbi:MAG: UDP-N-acetylmuramoyl-tripeptide--D-alanyl-D-alanine ligase [Flavobacteriaceae bacterium]|nr:UDP-N-acetylmuramoyl-tripeptide--D-alanyl-D-alanine ligase [Flavobacteriaceae bacterium]
MNITDIYTIFKKSSGINTDTRTILKNNLFFSLSGENFNGNKFAKQALEKGATYAIIDDKDYIQENTILVKDTLKTLQELAKHHRNHLNIPVIALTGSNGKTTTKELINCVLSKKYKTSATKGNLNNHIGVPLTLLAMDSTTEIGIVEMGANNFNEIKLLADITSPDFGYITNFGKAHLEGFGNLDGVIKAKSELYQHLRDHNKTVFINQDNSKQIEKSKNINKVTFSESNNTDTNISFLRANPNVTISYKEKEINSNLIGSYNFTNIAAAISIGEYFKVNTYDIISAIETYTPNNNRSQIIHKNNNKIILDAYNANPTSMKAALESFDAIQAENKAVFIGDMFELGETTKEEHQDIVDYIETLNIKHSYIIGEHFKETAHNHKTKSFIDFHSLSDSYNDKLSNYTILIKGSRGMALERILELL